MERSRMILALGPTNTGKTHRALQSMLEHETGMIGLPLRLLAREVFDRVARQVGADQVALVTGEEKLIPRRPRYWVCTVEAMPMEREVDFVAVDEIQLCNHRERGHVFTNRLLHARGRKETWFLGSDTMTGVLAQLLPHAELRRFPRLSRLRHEGEFSLGSLRPRSAVVAFSLPKLYEVAEKIRARKGGCAVVIGALSPRARNAQVELYQSGEVDFLVASDAIGMGLNLDIDHVAFADLRKFDGVESRELELGELGQIAGRAGRYLRDGGFGTFRPCRPLSPGQILAVEEHRFSPVTRLAYRNFDLDFTNSATLLESLAKPPPHPVLRPAVEAEDSATLNQLLRDANVREAAATEERVELLWEVCQIPDYRKLLLDEHAKLAREIYLRLVADGVLRSTWLESRITRLRSHSGDIESITNRIAFVRTWKYVAYKRGFVESPERFQSLTQELEDELSDALHGALVERFVERRKKTHASRSQQSPGKSDRSLASQLGKIQLRLAEPASNLGEELQAAPDAEFAIRPTGEIFFREQRIAQLRRGNKVSDPRLKLLLDVEGGNPQRQAVESRLLKFLKHWRRPLEPLLHLQDSQSSATRGIAYQLREGLGSAPRAQLEALIQSLDGKEKQALRDAGIELGQRHAFVRGSLKPGALQRRATLVRVHQEGELPKLLGERAVSRGELKDTIWLLLGYQPLGSFALRHDVLQKVSAASSPSSQQVAAWTGLKKENIAALLRSLNARTRSRRRRRGARKKAARSGEGPGMGHNQDA